MPAIEERLAHVETLQIQLRYRWRLGPRGELFSRAALQYRWQNGKGAGRAVCGSTGERARPVAHCAETLHPGSRPGWGCHYYEFRLSARNGFST